MSGNKNIDLLVKTLSSNIPGGSDLWPLKPLQLFPYIDADQSLDLLSKIKDLKKRKISIKEVASSIQRPSIIRHLISNITCTGLKVAYDLKLADLSQQDLLIPTTYFINVLEELTPQDPFCEKGTNKIHSTTDINNFQKSLIWKEADKSNIKIANSLSVDLISFIWAFYWPYFPSAGYEAYGPYDVSKIFGYGNNLIIKEYYNLKPIEVWPAIKDLPFNSIKIFQVYNSKNIKLNYSNRILSDDDLTSLNTAIAIKVNGRNVGDYSDLYGISKLIEQQTRNQTEYINSLNDLDKVKKGAMLSYYSLKDFYLTFWDSWFPQNIVEKTIKTIGEKFTKENINQKNRSPEELTKLFDPREKFSTK